MIGGGVWVGVADAGLRVGVNVGGRDVAIVVSSGVTVEGITVSVGNTRICVRICVSAARVALLVGLDVTNSVPAHPCAPPTPKAISKTRVIG